MTAPSPAPDGRSARVSRRRRGAARRSPPAVAVVVVLLALGACGSGPSALPTGPGGPSGPVVPAPVTSVDVPVGADGADGAVALHVRLSGPPDAPPVVLLHGFPESGATWDAVAADLARDHRVVAPDLRGAGRSSFAPTGPDGAADASAYSKRALAADLAGLVERLGLGPATVVGHDMGAMTAFAWARARPDQVARLVMTGGGVPGFGLLEQGPPHVRGFAAEPPGVLERRRAGDERGFLTRFVEAGAGPAGPTDELARLADDAVRAYDPPGRLDAAFGQYRALDRDADDNRDPALGPRVLPMPVLVIATALPDLTDTTLRDPAPHRRLVVVPGAGHFLPTERPAETASAVREEVAGSARPSG